MIRIKDDGTVVEREEYRAILAGVSLGEDITYSMEELAGLSEAAGIHVLGTLTQNVNSDSSTQALLFMLKTFAPLLISVPFSEPQKAWVQKKYTFLQIA